MRLDELIKSGNFVRVMEMFPPALPFPRREIERKIDSTQDSNLKKYDLSLRFDRLVEGIEKLESLADGFSLPELKDSQRIHLNSIGIATELKRRTGNDIVPTITLRDSNRQSLLGAIAYGIYAGIENILLVRGDPFDSSKSKTAPANVYDIKKISILVSEVRKLESHLSNSGKLCILCPINLAKVRDRNYLKISKERQASGTDVFLAEQMFESVGPYIERIDSLRKAGVSLPIIHSIFPIKDYEDGKNCVEKFGWNISKEELHKLKTYAPGFGLEMARHRYHSLMDRRDKAEGVCISTRGDPETARLITS